MSVTYKFYPQAADGSATSFESAKLASDAEAIARAPEVLARYPGATAVVVWDKGRLVQLLRAEGSEPDAEADEPMSGRKPARKLSKGVRRPARKPAPRPA